MHAGRCSRRQHRKLRRKRQYVRAGHRRAQGQNQRLLSAQRGDRVETANGFYYPPAFHSQNLFFDKVPIRHYVVEPSFADNQLFKTDLEAAKNRYCNFNNTVFNNFSDIDRQTELNDDDGSLTGLVKTISVNQDAFFNAPYATWSAPLTSPPRSQPFPPTPVQAPPRPAPTTTCQR